MLHAGNEFRCIGCVGQTVFQQAHLRVVHSLEASPADARKHPPRGILPSAQPPKGFYSFLQKKATSTVSPQSLPHS